MFKYHQKFIICLGQNVEAMKNFRALVTQVNLPPDLNVIFDESSDEYLISVIKEPNSYMLYLLFPSSQEEYEATDKRITGLHNEHRVKAPKSYEPHKQNYPNYHPSIIIVTPKDVSLHVHDIVTSDPMEFFTVRLRWFPSNESKVEKKTETIIDASSSNIGMRQGKR